MFQKGQSGNPGGRRRCLGLTRLTRKREGLRTWEKLTELRDNTPGIDPRHMTRICELILAYCGGRPVETVIEERLSALEEGANNAEG